MLLTSKIIADVKENLEKAQVVEAIDTSLATAEEKAEAERAVCPARSVKKLVLS